LATSPPTTVWNSNVGAPASVACVQPAGSAGGVTPSKFWLAPVMTGSVAMSERLTTAVPAAAPSMPRLSTTGATVQVNEGVCTVKLRAACAPAASVPYDAAADSGTVGPATTSATTLTAFAVPTFRIVGAKSTVS
jgi:hypothetical protein